MFNVQAHWVHSLTVRVVPVLAIARAQLRLQRCGTSALPERTQKPASILILEDRFAAIPAIHHMINRPDALHPQLAWQRPKSAKTTAPVSKVWTDPFLTPFDPFPIHGADLKQQNPIE